MTFLLIDFSNAARRLVTKTKRVGDLLNKEKNIVTRITPNQISVTKVPKIGYTDAAQILRRGKITPIKSDKAISRSPLWQHPQDNTVYNAIQRTVEKKGRKEPIEVATLLRKKDSRSRLQHTPFAEGNSQQVGIPTKPRDVVGSVHSHPYVKGDLKKDIPVPSYRDLDAVAWLDNKKKLKNNSEHSIIALHPTDKTTVTKYSVKGKIPTDDNKGVKSRKEYRKKYGQDYTVITKNKNQ